MPEQVMYVSADFWYRLEELAQKTGKPINRNCGKSDLLEFLVDYYLESEKAKELRNPDAWDTKVWIWDNKENRPKQIEGVRTSKIENGNSLVYFTDKEGKRYELGTFFFSKEQLLELLNNKP